MQYLYPCNFSIGYKGNKITLFINYVKVFEGADDYTVVALHRWDNGYRWDIDNLYMIIKREDLYGFLSFNYFEESKKFEWKLFEPKYKSLEISQAYSSSRSYRKMNVFEATDENGDTFFVNEKGIEFRR